MFQIEMKTTFQKTKQAILMYQDLLGLLFIFAAILIPQSVCAQNRVEDKVMASKTLQSIQKETTNSELYNYYKNNKQSLLESEIINYRSIMPTDLEPTNDQTKVLAVIADRGVNQFINSPQVKESFFGRTTEKIDKKMNQRIEIKSQILSEVSHIFNFQFQVFQTQAKIDYCGFFNASYSYRIRENESRVQLSKDIFNHTALVLSHSVVPQYELSELHLKWGW